jgi:hypothetical protein
MNQKVELINALSYKNEKGEGTRILCRSLEKDSLQNSKKLKGYSELTFFVDATAFDKIPIELFGQMVTLTAKEKPNPRNPFKTTIALESINDISLV